MAGVPLGQKMRRFYRASFNPDLLLVPEQDDDLPRLCYALPADSAAPLFASERLKKLLEDAVTSLGGMKLTSLKTREDMRPASVQSVRDQGSTVKGPRTITDGGVRRARLDGSRCLRAPRAGRVRAP